MGLPLLCLWAVLLMECDVGLFVFFVHTHNTHHPPPPPPPPHFPAESFPMLDDVCCDLTVT